MSVILRVPRHDKNAPQDSIVAINVVPSSSKDPLDITIVGTEGENPYVYRLNHNTLHKHKAPRSPGSNSDWESIVHSIFITRSSHQDVEIIVSDLVPEDSVTLTIRRNIEGITSRLGSFQLSYDEDQIIDPIDWISISCLETTSIRAKLDEANETIMAKDEALNILQSQIEEFTRLSQQHENDLLRNFQKLLNSKKAKIRDQQRLLAHATVDAGAVQRIVQRRVAEVTGSGKTGGRKRAARVVDEDDESDEFEDMGGSRKENTGIKEDSQESEDLFTESEGEEASDEEIAAPLVDKDKEMTMPPPRQLPVQRKEKGRVAATKANKRLAEDDDETASEDEDDEL